MVRNISKYSIFFIIIFVLTLNGCKQAITINASKPTLKDNSSSALSNTATNLKVTDIYKLNIIGKTPLSVAYKIPGFGQTVAYLGIWDGSAFTAKLDYSVDEPSGFGFGTSPSIIDKRLIYKPDTTANKIDINKLLVVYVKEGPYADSPEEIIAYSKATDTQNRVNNISEIQFGIDNIKKSDIIASIVAVVKDGDRYKLASNTVNSHYYI